MQYHWGTFRSAARGALSGPLLAGEVERVEPRVEAHGRVAPEHVEGVAEHEGHGPPTAVRRLHNYFGHPSIWVLKIPIESN